MSYYPLFPFILALSTWVFIILIGVIDEKPYRFFQVIAIFLMLLYIPIALFYDAYVAETILETVYMYLSMVSIIVFIATSIVVFRKGLFTKNHYHLFIKSIKATKWNAYYVIDHKGRIKEMSDSLCEEFGFTLEQIKDKAFFDIVNRSIRITSFDGVETNNRAMETYYEDYPRIAKPKMSEEHEMLFQNYQGKPVLLHTVEQPIFILGKYKGRINIGERRSDFDLLSIEKELKTAEQNLESMRLKFIATLELSDEGLFYMDLDERYIWGNDQFVQMTGIPQNTIDLDDFRKLIKDEDLQTYLGVLSGLTARKQTYKTTYRLLKQGYYIWVKESGKRIFEDKSSNIVMGSLNVVQTSSYQKINISEIDGLLGQPELLLHLDQLVNANKHFQLALIELSSIPKINESYGREIGNMLMGEYIKKLKGSFMSESSSLFRLSGLVFAITIVDPRKMDLLKQGIQANQTYMNLQMNYGSIKTDLEVMIGISRSHADGATGTLIYQHAKDALMVARNPQYQSNACYYHEIHG